MTDSIPDLGDVAGAAERRAKALADEREKKELLRAKAVEKATKRAFKGIYSPLFRKAISK